MQFVASRAKPHNLALLISISVDTSLVNIGISRGKNPTNNNILLSMKNATLSENTTKK